MTSSTPNSQPRSRLVPVNDGAAATIAEAGLATGQPVVVLIGGAAKLDESGADLYPIVRAVIAAVQADGATVVDGGTDAGVMAMAGRARAELGATVPLVGVAPIGRVTATGIAAATGTTALEPNHSHQLLAPGDEWGAELPVMIEAARTLSAGKPVVGVLVDGGPLALTEATKLLAEGWPLITIAGSGRAADDLVAIGRGSSLHVLELAKAAADVGPLLHTLLTAAGAGPQRIDYPALYLAASAASKRGRGWFRGLTAVELGIAVAGVALTILAAQFLSQTAVAGSVSPAGLFISFVLVGAFLFAFVVKLINRSSGYDDKWFVGRAVAEAVKSASWKYMMRVAPFDEANADERLEEQLAALLARADDIPQAADKARTEAQPISASMRQVRALDLDRRREAYRRLRISEQVQWYLRKSGNSRYRGTVYFWASTLLQVAAATTAFLALYLAAQPDIGPFWLRVMSLCAAVALALTAWSQLNRHDELARAYAYSAQELTLIDGSAGRAHTDEQLAEVVNEAEEALGRENRAWLAKRVESYTPPDYGQVE